MSTISDAPSTRPVVWSIASSDCSGHAGLQADLATIAGLACHGCSIVSGVTAQNSQGLVSIEATSKKAFENQISALDQDLPAQAIKIGLLADKQHLLSLLSYLSEKGNNRPTVILDPVLGATTGALLSPVEPAQLLALLPFCDLFTPNLDEAEALLNATVRSPDEIQLAAQEFHKLGAKGVLIKGGHGHENTCNDYLSIAEPDGTWTRSWLVQPRLNAKNMRGTGCTLASAIACFVALGERLRDAVTLGNAYVHQGILSGYQVGQGAGPIHRGGYPENYQLFPKVVDNLEHLERSAFPDCGDHPLGLYPVVDSVEWLEKLLPLGIDTAQIRIKDVPLEELEPILVKAIQLGKQYDCRLFINDYWELAIKHDAYGVHLGQEDIETADLEAIQAANIRLGISTHGDYEWARAASQQPSYLAIGAIFPTDTKDVHVVGLPRLRRWVNLLKPAYPLTAIGGINLERLDGVLGTGVDSVAVVSAITKADDHKIAVAQFQNALKSEL